MTTISDHVSVSVLDGSQGISQANFGTPGICCYHERWAGAEVREYTSLEGMVDDGFAATGASSGPYLAAQAIFSQNPRPDRLKVGNRAAAPTQIQRITPVPQGIGYVHTITVADTAATTNGGTINYTELGGATATSIATALTPLLTALTTNAVFADATGSITVTGATPGIFTQLTTDEVGLLVEDETVDAGIATDLAAMEAYDPDFYGVSLGVNAAGTEIIAAAAWTEARDKLLFANTRDWDVIDAGETGDVATSLSTAAYDNTAIVWAPNLLQSAGSAALGMGLSRTVGSFTWKFKTLSGVTVGSLTASMFAAAKAKNCNYYVATAGVNILGEGIVSSGKFIDVIRTKHKAKARIGEAIYGKLVREEKVDFTDDGVESVALAGLGALQRMEKDGAFVRGSSRYEIALVEDMDANDIANRIVRGLKYFTTLRGAVHELELTVRVELPGS